MALIPFLALVFHVFLQAGQGTADDVRVLEFRVPEGGIQPQAVADADGSIHLLFFAGDPKAGDLRYTRRGSGAEAWLPSILVNSIPGSAMAVGTIRGGQLALGRGGQVHVAWMGSSKAPPAEIEGKSESPMLYTRLSADRKSFEPERNILRISGVLDGGGSVAADQEGRVWVAWHGQRPGGIHSEQRRELFAALSVDDGASFAIENSIGATGAGSCACCGMKVLALPGGALVAAYRTARNPMDRDMELVWHGGGRRPWASQSLAPWKIAACPMSSASLIAGRNYFWAAWEQDGRVQARGWSFDAGKPTRLIEPGRGGGKMRHPSIAVDGSGGSFLGWTEGTGWQRGGRAVWQRFGVDGKPIGEAVRRDGVPAWGTIAVGVGTAGYWVIY